jgi:hypothetical protein
MIHLEDEHLVVASDVVQTGALKCESSFYLSQFSIPSHRLSHPRRLTYRTMMKPPQKTPLIRNQIS